MTLPYELAKKLKDAGWPQPSIMDSGEECWVDPPGQDHCHPSSRDYAYSPSLEELIEACPQEMTRNELPHTLGVKRNFVTGQWEAAYFLFEPSARPKPHSEYGSTPSEAVANLWLALKAENLITS